MGLSPEFISVGMKSLSADRVVRNALVRQFLGRLDRRSPQEAAHAARVAVYSVATGGELGLPEPELFVLRNAAALHDLGKLRWPGHLFEAVLDLSEPERSAIRSHPLRGAQEVECVTWLKPSQEGILYHHERWDGSGYPFGLVGEQIPLAARIIAVSEVFDCLTMPCGWKAPIGEAQALALVAAQAGVGFDPEVVAVFLKCQPIIQPVGL
jgi:HD-GYP domain-containing protein (c-di-GMP phosphodiesterase class II)